MSKQVNPVSIACALRASLHYLAAPIDFRKYRVGRSEYICFALDAAVVNGRVAPETAEATKHMIMERLHPQNNVYTWLVTKGYHEEGDEYSEASLKESFANVQEFRHNWVEAMAKEYFALGKSVGGLGPIYS